MTDLQLIGLKRTCTNWLGRLVEQNFSGVRCWHGPKHEIPAPVLPDRDGYLVCVKHPAAWFLSMQRYRRVAPRRVRVAHKAKELAEQWNQGVRSQLELLDSRPDAVLVRYRDLLAEPVAQLRLIAHQFALAEPENWQIEQHTMLRGGDEMRGDQAVDSSTFDQREYYLDGGYMREIGEHELSILASTLDRDLMSRLGYPPL